MSRLLPWVVCFAFSCSLVSVSFVSVAQQRSTRPARFQVVETTIVETQAAILAGKVTCRQLVQIYLDRLAAYDQSTRLNTIVVLNPTALEDADRLHKKVPRRQTPWPPQGA